MRATRLLALVLAIVPVAFGCGDDLKFLDQDEPVPALNGVFPAKGFTDRTLRVEISGDDTEFTGTPTISFGAGITVADVELSSPRTLFATITIAGDAAVGKRDVTVTGAGDPLTLTAAFDVQYPLEVLLDGAQLQGGLGQMLIITHDPEHPFLGDLEITAGNGTTIEVALRSFTDEFHAFASVACDTDAVSGPLVVKDTLFDTVISRGGELVVTPRTAVAMTASDTGPSFATSGTLTASTGLFSFTAESALYRGIMSSEEVGLIWLPDGKWAQAGRLAQDDLVRTVQGQSMFVVAFGGFDIATASGFDLSVDEFHPLPGVVALAEVENNDQLHGGTAQVINQAVTLFTGELDSGDDADMMKVTLTVGGRIRVTTETRFDSPNTAVRITDSAFETIEHNDDISSATNLLDSDVDSGPLGPGTYFIEISGSPFFNVKEYEAAITLSGS